MIILIFPLLFVFIGWLIFGKKTTNPYIKTHKRKWQNELDYREYIKWLDKSGGDIPYQKIKCKEEQELEKEINKNLKL